VAEPRTFTVLHLFAGLGGGALGFQQARGRWGALDGRFRTVAGIDCDEEACRDFEALTGAPAVRADLATMTPGELRAVAGSEAPDVVFASPPCKGFSGLLPTAAARSERYQALNRLVLQGLWLVLETWSTRPPRLILVENVPRITTRGKVLLAQVRDLLARYGYRVNEQTHDAGELGGLGQHRRRFLLLARHAPQIPNLVYKPPRQHVRSIGEVLGDLPLPDDPSMGPLHRLPRLEWRTYLRLALIPASGDWRALQDLDFSARRVVPFNNVWRVVRWDEAAGAVTSGGGPTSSGCCVADPRLGHQPRGGTYRVVRADEPAPTVIGSEGVGRSSAFAFADPRLPDAPGRHESKLRVEGWDRPAHTVTGSDRVGSGAPSVADPRAKAWGNWAGRPGLMGVAPWDQPISTVTGTAKVTSSNATAAVADPRLGCTPRNGTLGVLPWGGPSGAVIGAADIHAGAFAVGDPRLPADTDRLDPPPVIISEDGTWHRPLTSLELAALQGLPVRMPDGSPLRLAGRADSRWRERVGNAVPPPAARAIAEQILQVLLEVSAGASSRLLTFSDEDVWVEEREEALHA